MAGSRVQFVATLVEHLAAARTFPAFGLEKMGKPHLVTIAKSPHNTPGVPLFDREINVISLTSCVRIPDWLFFVMSQTSTPYEYLSQKGVAY